jgi:hypothetical protein
MEIEVRNRKRQHILLPRKLPLPSAELHHHLALLHAIQALRVHLLEHLDRLRDARLQLGEGRLVVLHGHGLGLGDAHDEALGGVADALDLVGQRGHVGHEARLEERGFVAGDVRAAFLEEGGEGFEGVDEGGDGDLVEAERHFEGVARASLLVLCGTSDFQWGVVGKSLGKWMQSPLFNIW